MPLLTVLPKRLAGQKVAWLAARNQFRLSPDAFLHGLPAVPLNVLWPHHLLQ